MGEVIDLDALVPQSRFVKLDGQEIEIKPPKTGSLFKLGSLGEKMQKVDTSDQNALQSVIDEMTIAIVEIVPELAGKNLAASQLIKLFEIISEMATPPNAVELAKRGIDTNSPKAQ